MVVRNGTFSTPTMRTVKMRASEAEDIIFKFKKEEEQMGAQEKPKQKKYVNNKDYGSF